MNYSKNKTLLKAIFITSLFASFAAKAESIVVDYDETNQISLDDGDSLTITSEGSLITPGFGVAALVQSVSADFIINNGTILSAGEGGIIVQNDAFLNLVENNGSNDGIVLYDAEVTTINNNGNNEFIYINFDSTVDTINNSGNIDRDLSIVDDSIVNIINNSGYIDGDIYVEDSEVTTINNKGEINDNIQLFNSTITTIDNSGNINDDVVVWNNSSATTINNSGNIDGTISINNSTATTINNSGNLINGGGISVLNDSTVTTINNSGYISGTIFTLYEGAYVTTINNSGFANSISTANEAQVGTINNSGSANFIGVYSDAQVGTINNSGTIYNGILVNENASVGEIINSGLIIVGESAQAIDFGDTVQDITLTLNPGSQITGNIDLGSGTNTININSGPQVSSTYYYTSNADVNINSAEGLIVVSSYIAGEEGQDGNGKISVVDPSSFATTQEVSLKSSIDIGNIIADRLTQARAQNNSAKVAQNESYVELAALNNNRRTDENSEVVFNKFNENQTYFWSELFGSYQERAAYKNNGESESTTGGIIFGADKAISADQRLGGFVGALNGSTDISVANNFISSKVDSKGIFGGAYLSNNHPNKDCFLDLSLIAGVLENDSNRVVFDGGTQIAQADYNTIFITPSATIGKGLNTPIIPTIISTTLRYTGQWVESYDENGTASSNISADSRYLNTISARLKIETNNAAQNIANGNFQFNVRAGIEANRVLGNQNVDITVLGQTVAVGQDNRNYNIDGFVGFNTSYDLKDNVRIYADIEGTKGITKSVSNNDLGLYGKFGLKVGF